MQPDIELVDTILSLLPPEWRAHAIAIAVLVATLSAAVAPLKWAAAKYITSPQMRAWADALFTALDWVALNTRSLRDRPMAQPRPKAKS